MNRFNYRSETDLVEYLKARDQTAFQYLYDNYATTLFKVILQIVPTRDEAEDILQKVFVNIWTKLEGYDPDKGRLFTWVLNIARNASIDTLRSKDYQYRRRVINYPPEEINDFCRTSYFMSTDAIGLNRYVRMLKPQQRQLIELVYYQGFSQPEIAALQSTPLSTIKTRIKSALSQLRVLIGAQ
ncbi:MAG TPA: sigma-70 family RNA polymerase sigma factor [Flavitalea sp.]|nr:sigma-70 family RNA polymerase sigma factor [Flavitalea sp.]